VPVVVSAEAEASALSYAAFASTLHAAMSESISSGVWPFIGTTVSARACTTSSVNTAAHTPINTSLAIRTSSLGSSALMVPGYLSELNMNDLGTPH